MPEHSTPALAVRDAHKSFGRRRALDGVGFTLRPGEWVGLLGPNGAGKTTLMQAVAGLVRLDGGEIELFGHPIGGRNGTDPRARVGLVPQETALYPALTAEENLTVFARLHGLRRAGLAERVRRALAWTGLAPRASDRVGGLSGGMKRRLNIACGVLHRPRVVLLDEPTVGVDPQGRRRIHEMLEQLRGEGASLVQSTHELNEIESVCDRMLVMDHGRIIADGTVEALVARAGLGVSRLRLRLARPAPGLDLGEDTRVEGDLVRAGLRDVAGELPTILARVRQAGHTVRSVDVESPGLEDVFTRLTGRELRE